MSEERARKSVARCDAWPLGSNEGTVQSHASDHSCCEGHVAPQIRIRKHAQRARIDFERVMLGSEACSTVESARPWQQRGHKESGPLWIGEQRAIHIEKGKSTVSRGLLDEADEKGGESNVPFPRVRLFVKSLPFTIHCTSCIDKLCLCSADSLPRVLANPSVAHCAPVAM